MMNIFISGTLYSSRYEYDLLRVHEIIARVYDSSITVALLDQAIRGLSLDPTFLYHDLSAGYETWRTTLLTKELGLPPFSLSCYGIGGYWEQRLIDMAKRDGKSPEEIGRIDADLTQLAESLSIFGFGKEAVAKLVVDLNESLTPLPSDMIAVMQEAIKSDNQTVQISPVPKPKRITKLPYYAKNKHQHWRKR
jgi:hypothetical protein